LATIEGLTPAMLVTLGENGIKTLDDLADLSSGELVDKTDGILRESGLGEAEANNIIMAARAHWFEGEQAAAGEEKAAN
jgi:N utilization substance protein A